MIRAKINIDTSETRKLAKQLNSYQVNKAVSKALNDTLRAGRTAGKRAVTDRYNIPAYRVTSSRLMRSNFARSGSLHARLLTSANSVKVASFRGLRGDGITVRKTKSKGTKLKQGRTALDKIARPSERKPVQVKIKKGGGFVTIPDAFIARTGSHVGVFQRKRKGPKNYSAGRFRLRKGKRSRLNSSGPDAPIGSLFSFTVFKAFTTPTAKRKILSRVEPLLPNRAEFWLKRALNG